MVTISSWSVFNTVRVSSSGGRFLSRLFPHRCVAMVLRNHCIYQHVYGSYREMIDHEREEAKSHILIEDKTLRFKVDDKTILETILDTPVNNYWDFWIKDKHYFFINLTDPQLFHTKSLSMLSDAKFPIQSKIFCITKIPCEKGSPLSPSNITSQGIPQKRFDIRLQRQSAKSAQNLTTDIPVDKAIKKFTANLSQNELECKLKFFTLDLLEELLCQGAFGAFRLVPFGSSANSLGWGSSGLDLCLTTKYQSEPNSTYVASCNGLLDGATKRQRCIKMYTTLMKVDLILGVNNANQPNNQTVQLFSNYISNDVTITCIDPVNMELFKMSEILFQLTRTDERILHLITFCKLWAEVQGCISLTFNNFLLTMLIINYLQVRKPFPILPPMESYFQSTEIQLEPNQIQDRSSSFTDILQGFFRHIGTFDFTNSGANLFLGKTVRKPTRDAMLILDPARGSNMAVKVTKKDLDSLLRAALQSYKLLGSGCHLQTLLKPITQEMYKKLVK